MLCSRRVFVAGALAALAGCGFTPVHGPEGPAPRGVFALVAPETPNGYTLAGRLEERLGTPVSNPRYTLTVTLEEEEATSVVTRDHSTQRYSLLGTAHWRISEGGADIASGHVDSFTSYSASGPIPTTEAARANAQHRLAIGLADRVVTQVWMALP